MKTFVDALEQISGDVCQVERCRPSVYRMICGKVEEARLKVMFYRIGAAMRLETGERGFLHIDEDRWLTQSEQIKARLIARAGQGGKIHARDTVVARIDKKQAMNFQQDHHLQGALPGKYRYGLFLNGELVSVAVFSGGRKMWELPENERSFELLRFCHKGALRVTGGLSKLLRQFEKEHRPGDIMTYLDRDWSDGEFYAQLGFEVRGMTDPQEFWVEHHTWRRYTPYDLPETGSFYRSINRGSLKLVKAYGRLRNSNPGTKPEQGQQPNPVPIVILGPTASGKTRFAVEMARRIGGAIISADSRQVYRGLNIGTGKDLEEYGEIPHYLIDILDAGDRYNVSDFLADAEKALNEIRQKGLVPIICGGTGMYIQGLLQGYPYSDVPGNESLRSRLQNAELDELRAKLAALSLPSDFRVDTSTRKRLIRAIEIADWLSQNPGYVARPPLCPEAKVYGLAPDRKSRREAISARLRDRLDQGLLNEVRGLLDRGLTPDQLIYYGLEYKYCTLYLTGQLDGYEDFVNRLETEIHRFAKRQMTYFRKMEKDGIQIEWLGEAN